MSRQKAVESGLNARQMRYLTALLSGKTKEAAAREAGVSPRTARTWHHDARFQRALTEAIDSALRDTLAGISSLLPEAVQSFADGLRHGTPQQRASVAEKLVTTLLRLRVDADLTERIQRLETETRGEEHARFSASSGED
jgi:hypothetical protein